MTTTALPSPKPADPVEGQPGHFTHSNWTKAAVEALDSALNLGTFGVPIGTIVAFSGSATLPSNWAICNGLNGTPDLQGKFILGASSARPAGSGGGAETVPLSVAHMPTHSHGGGTGAMSANNTHFHNGRTGEDSPDHTHLLNRTTWQSGAQGEVQVYQTRIENAFSVQDGTTGANTRHAHDFGTNTVDLQHSHGITAEGSGVAHENMPPYWALVYIMRVA